jgi:hypothetical protein
MGGRGNGNGGGRGIQSDRGGRHTEEVMEGPWPDRRAASNGPGTALMGDTSRQGRWRLTGGPPLQCRAAWVKRFEPIQI